MTMIDGQVSTQIPNKKRPYRQPTRQKSNKKQRRLGATRFEGTHDEVLLADVRRLAQTLSPKRDQHHHKLPELQSEVELVVQEVSSTGDALAVEVGGTNHIYVVPFSISGDVVIAKVYKNNETDGYSLTDLVKVKDAGPARDDSLIRCPYFATCSGCQLQMIPYADQLQHKRQIIVKAYHNFSSLPAALVPTVGQTVGSPLEYGYRTKLTPHFDGPPNGRRDRRDGKRPRFQEVPPIGFMKKNTKHTIDIEDCPIGTDAVRLGMKKERLRVTDELDTYVRGATLLLRESTKRIPRLRDGTLQEPAELAGNAIFEDRGEHVHEKTCITDNNGRSTEYIDDYIFENPAGAFFQNNNSILPVFTQYIRSHILPPHSEVGKSGAADIKNLIDAYSGSGLFTITLAALFQRSIGIDIAASSIDSATKNAELNHLPASQASFIAADAANLFASVADPTGKQYMNPDETVVVIDPPRKGCDESFLRQLLKFGPERVVYVSCNVHTQARDIGILVGGMAELDAGFGLGNGVYQIESLRGFDFFPQTGHVEAVAVLQKKSCKSTVSVPGQAFPGS